MGEPLAEKMRKQAKNELQNPIELFLSPIKLLL